MGLRRMAASAAIIFVSSAANAGVADVLTAAINNCAAITDDGTRHACYDRLPQLLKAIAPVAATEATPPAAAQPSAPPPVAEKPAAEKESSGGVFGLFASEPIPADHISATVESFTSDYGLFVVTLDNGQVWRQVAAIGSPVRLNREKKDQVTIWRNSFGEDVLRVEGYHTTYHVRRMK